MQIRFGFSGDCDGLIRPYALASQVPGKNLDFFMFDGDTEYETSASIGSPAVHSTGNIPDPTVIVPTATQSQLFNDFSRKYREQFVPVNVGGQNCLQPFFAGQGNYTAYDNHELGNKQYINGGAPAGGGVGSTTGSPPFDFATGAGVDARDPANDVTPNDGSVPFINKSGGFQTLQQVFENYQPLKERGLINAPADPRTIPLEDCVHEGRCELIYTDKNEFKLVFRALSLAQYRSASVWSRARRFHKPAKGDRSVTCSGAVIVQEGFDLEKVQRQNRV